jgi:hypothetical protein
MPYSGLQSLRKGESMIVLIFDASGIYIGRRIVRR